MEPEDLTQSKGPNLGQAVLPDRWATQASVDLPIEATLVVEPSAREKTWPTGDMPGRIIELCSAPQSVAEVSASSGFRSGWHVF